MLLLFILFWINTNIIIMFKHVTINVVESVCFMSM